jgi:hypothetical protein
MSWTSRVVPTAVARSESHAPQLRRIFVRHLHMGKRSETKAPPAEIKLRITVVQPPAGVEFRLQEGRADLVAPARVSAGQIEFEFALRLGAPRNGQPNFLGPAAQGPPAGRFVYINSGRRAGQQHTFWDRRAKVPLKGITKTLVQAALRDNGVLEARIAGTARDGGPACATVPLVSGAWRLVPGTA